MTIWEVILDLWISAKTANGTFVVAARKNGEMDIAQRVIVSTIVQCLRLQRNSLQQIKSIRLPRPIQLCIRHNSLHLVHVQVVSICHRIEDNEWFCHPIVELHNNIEDCLGNLVYLLQTKSVHHENIFDRIQQALDAALYNTRDRCCLSPSSNPHFCILVEP